MQHRIQPKLLMFIFKPLQDFAPNYVMDKLPLTPNWDSNPVITHSRMSQFPTQGLNFREIFLRCRTHTLEYTTLENSTMCHPGNITSSLKIQIHLHSQLNALVQWTGQIPLQDETKTFMFRDWVRLILEIWRYILPSPNIYSVKEALQL